MKHTLLLFLSVLFYAVAIAQPSGWSYVQPYTVTNTSATAGTNIQVLVTVNTQALVSASQMQADGDDIRFGTTCAGTTLLDYWLDEPTMNTTATNIWVKIPSFPASSSVIIYMFWGNASATAVSDITIFSGPYSSISSQVTSGTSAGVGSSQRGFRFQPNEDLLVADFGKKEPSGTTRYVTLFDYTTETIVTQGQVSGSSTSTYVYSAIQPVWLTSGTQYILSVFQGSSDGYYFASNSQVDAAITYHDMRYCNNCTQNTFPSSHLNGYQYGYPDFRFYKRNTLPSPPTVTTGGGNGMITSHPGNTTVCPGASAMFAVAAVGSSNSYQWQYNTGSGFTNVPATSPYSNVTTDELTITGVTQAMSTYQYRCVVTNNCGVATSNAGILTVPSDAQPTITIDASPGTTVCEGSNVTYNVISTTNAGVSPSFQWKLNGSNISGATSSSYATSSLSNGDEITCVITSSNTCASPATGTSSAAVMTINANPIITSATTNSPGTGSPPFLIPGTYSYLELDATANITGGSFKWIKVSSGATVDTTAYINIPNVVAYFSPAPAWGDYSVTVTSADGCRSEAVVVNVGVDTNH